MPDTPTTRPSLLARLATADDAQAWDEFLEIYQPLLARYARRKNLQPADTDELIQEVLVAVSAAVERWDPDRSKGRFRHWLVTVARNITVDQFARSPQAAGGSAVNALLQQQPATQQEDSELFDLEYQRQVFRWAAQRIRPQFRPTTWQAFWLTAVEEQDPQAVAHQLDLTVGAVYKSRSRVMRRLKQEVQKFESQESE
jgi:RNA polymerase sigma factor (sigma-70 family)